MAPRLPFGEAVSVAEGIWIVRLPLPSKLRHVNAYVFDDADGWTVVDCGYATDEILDIWDRLFAGVFGGRRLRRLITTHGHTDHVGAVMHLLRRNDASYETTLIEWQAARLRYLEKGRTEDDAYIRFALLHGCNLQTARRFAASYRDAVRHLGEQPPTFLRIEDGDTVVLGGRTWKAMVFSGHAEAHMVLYCQETGLLLSGDQVLANISPVIPISAAQPEGNPLGGYLASLEAFCALPEDTLVMPGHGMPFKNLVQRCIGLANHHRDRLAMIQRLLSSPLTSLQICEDLFGKEKAYTHGRLALSETISHLNFLLRLGLLTRVKQRGVYYFSSPAPD